MSVGAILLPVFVEVGLVFVLLFWLGPLRVTALRRGETRIKDVALGQKAWPERALQIANSFDNQFQLPVLFYVVTILALVTQKAGIAFVVLAWIFVLSRIGHAVIHTTTNNMRRRFAAYLIGAVTLLILWVVFSIQVLFGV